MILVQVSHLMGDSLHAVVLESILRLDETHQYHGRGARPKQGQT